jgi:hypothetical protein
MGTVYRVTAEFLTERKMLELDDQARAEDGDLCSVKGEVGEPQVVRRDDDGALVSLPVRWDLAA